MPGRAHHGLAWASDIRFGSATSASDQRQLLRASGAGDPGVPINWRAEISGLRFLGFEPQLEFADSSRDSVCGYLLWCQAP